MSCGLKYSSVVHSVADEVARIIVAAVIRMVFLLICKKYLFATMYVISDAGSATGMNARMVASNGMWDCELMKNADSVIAIIINRGVKNSNNHRLDLFMYCNCTIKK